MTWPDLIIFDCDGVLADTELHGHLAAFNQMWKKLGVPWQWSAEQYAEMATTLADDGRAAKVTKEEEWTPLGVFPVMTAPGTQYLPLLGASQYIQATWTMVDAGDPPVPSFTFQITGQAVLVYVDPADLNVYGAPPAVMAQVTMADLDRYTSAGTDRASSLIANQQELPLLVWGDDLREAVSSLVIWSIMSRRVGFNVEDPVDSAFKINRDAALKFLQDVGEGVAQLAGVIDSATPIDVGGAQIYSDPPRGWDWNR